MQDVMGLEMRLRELLGPHLSLPAGEEPALTDPLEMHGLDSVRSAAFVVALEDWSGRRLPDGLLYECPTLGALVDYFRDGERVDRDVVASMREDARLPGEIHPSGPTRNGAPGTVLLTGATGLVGAQILETLCRQGAERILCLVRCGSPVEGLERLRAARRRFGLTGEILPQVEVVPGDLRADRLGLARERFGELAEEVDAVCHCAAEVNWVAGYEALRETNVRAVRALLTLATMGRRSSFVFLSSLATCYATNAPEEISESSEPADWFDGLHFGYAQSKAVAEMLVREAGRRGLPVTVLRPSLITGDSRTGQGNSGDFVSLLIKGCIELGSAPDLDWLMDFCPADHVAQVAVAALRAPRTGLRTLHLLNPRKRHWREGVLWMNLTGYRLRLERYRTWLAEFELACQRADFPLRPLRRFFALPVSGQGGLTLPEVYEESRRAHALRKQTADSLESWSLPGCPQLNGGLLDRYFGAFVAEGFLPPARPEASIRIGLPEDVLPAAFLREVGSSATGRQWRSLTEVEAVDASPEHSIITEMTAWGSRRVRGLFRYRLRGLDRVGRPHCCEVMLKLKPTDQEVLDVGQQVAALCDERLGEAYRRFRGHLEFNRCDRRELALYRSADRVLRDLQPRCFGAWQDSGGVRALALERLEGLVLMDSANCPGQWSGPAIEAVLRGMVRLHAGWFERREEWSGTGSPAPELSDRDMEDISPLWRSLAEFSRSVLGEDLYRAQVNLIEELREWWPCYRAHRCTLVHKDFNPRNLGLRRTGDGLRLCLYDWELAEWGAPQRDLAEFLCFVLRPDASQDELACWVELHRRGLTEASGTRFEAGDWWEGFRLSLDAFLLERLPFYVLVDRFRTQRFLPRVVATCRRLRALAASRPVLKVAGCTRSVVTKPLPIR